MPETTKPICILDDDSSVLSSLQELLASDGLEAETFDSQDIFLAYTQEHAVKLAVLDVWLRATNGIEVQARLHELSPDTGVIMITGREEAVIRAAALSSIQAGTHGGLRAPGHRAPQLGFAHEERGK